MEQSIHTVFTKKYTASSRLNDYLSSSLLVVVDYHAMAFAALCASLLRDEILFFFDELISGEVIMKQSSTVESYKNFIESLGKYITDERYLSIEGKKFFSA